MLTRRIIPCLDVTRGRVVKGTSFSELQDAGDPVELAANYYQEGADELVFLDIGATPEGRETTISIVEQVSERVFIPLTVGGGLRSLEHIERALKEGADKVSINTAAVQNPELILEAAKRFGSQCIVVAIDARRRFCLGSSTSDAGLCDSTGMKWEVYTHGGRKPSGLDAVEWAKQAVALGAGEILLTSWDADGHRAGYDLELTRAVSEAVGVPVIASGGAGNLEHIYQALVVGKASAVLAASIFHYGIYSIRQVKEYLARRGIPVREK